MQRLRIVCLVVIVLALLTSEAFGVVRVARRYNVIEAFGSSAQAWGEYSKIGSLSLPAGPLAANGEYKASVLLEPSFSLGFSYGQLRNNHFLGAVGFRYVSIKHSLEDIFILITDFNLHQYDIDLTLNYLPLPLVTSQWTPYFGVTVNAGLTVADPEGTAPDGRDYATESAVTIGLSANFGLDLKLWTNKKDRSFVTLSSVNSWNAVGSSNRPRFLQLGAGLKYWFRP